MRYILEIKSEQDGLWYQHGKSCDCLVDLLLWLRLEQALMSFSHSTRINIIPF